MKAKRYNSVRHVTEVDEKLDDLARMILGSCTFLTPARERELDLAIGIIPEINSFLPKNENSDEVESDQQLEPTLEELLAIENEKGQQ